MDLLLVGVFKLGVKGAAYATVLSQLLSLILVIIWLRRRNDCCKLIFRDIRFDSLMLRRTLMIGFPSGLQSMLYTISNLMIVTGINSFGTETVAAWAAYGKLDSLFWMICGSIGVAVTTFVGQNYGADKIDRSRKGVRTSFAIGLSASFTIQALMLLFSKYAYMLFVTDAAVISIGVRIINVIVPFYFTYIFVEILAGAIRATGKTLVSTLFTVFCIVVIRTLWLLIIPRHFSSLEAILLCYPVTWVICATAFILYYKFGNVYRHTEGEA